MQPVATALVERRRGSASTTRGGRRVRQRQAHVGRRDPALRVQHALEHRGVRLGEAGAAPPGSSASAWARPSSSLPASPHSIIATNRAVHTCADAEIAPAPPMHMSGKRNGSSPPSTAKPRGRVGEQLERVGVECTRPPASRRRCSDARRARAARPRRGRGRCGTGCCRATTGTGLASATAWKCATIPASDGRT